MHNRMKAALATGCWVGLMLPVASASAAGLVCTAARTPPERTVCARPDLRELDGQLQAAYDELRARPPRDPAALSREQAAWLRERDDCGNRVECLRTAYQQRTQALLNQLRLPFDTVDAQAAQALQKALAAQRNADPEFPIESALQPFLMREKLSTFVNTPAEDGSDGDRFPTRMPPGVTADEWAALTRAGIDGGGENGRASYALIDLDGDGRRDLLVDSYLGGTGLFNAINIWRQTTSGRFITVSHQAPDGDGSGGIGDFYTLNGRGGHQRAYWLRLQGRPYVAHVNSTYGRDTLRLLRPMGSPSTVALWQVHYQYRFTVPNQQVSDASGTRVPYTLPADTATALRQALKAVHVSEVVASGDKVLCPPPADASADVVEAHKSAGSSHYTVEVVQDLPVWLGGACRIARLINWFGRYEAEGLALQLWVGHQVGTDGQDTYQVDARRRVTRIEGGPVAVRP
ncbi:MAG: lysozyme inhibitor LprI family protein [Pseudomonadota bacterium]